MFGITHQDQHSRSYLVKMRSYMPAGHAAYINELEVGKLLPHAVDGNDRCSRAYTACVNALIDFRQSHLKMVEKYVSSQMSQMGPGHTGTGGTDPMVFLRQVAKDTTSLA